MEVIRSSHPTLAKAKPWLRSPLYDGIWILSPPFVATLLVAILLYLRPQLATQPLTPFAWLILVLAIDVSHVYASLYRTLFSAKMWEHHRLLLVLVPLLAYAASYAAYQWDALIFWRLLAYTAVFHFVRQPYGLMMLYKRREKLSASWMHRVDQLAIYTASLYPLILWHLDPSRTFSWFVSGDFLIVDGTPLRWMVHGLAALIAVLYLVKEWIFFRQTHVFNSPKNLVLLGTALSFGMGILYWNSDFAFTATNVISHGVAYMGLVWLTDASRYYANHQAKPSGKRLRTVKRLGPLFFIASLLILAFVEEGLWDTLVWGEHAEYFSVFPSSIQSAGEEALGWLIPLLALPQATHYIWDGFIWRKNHGAAGSIMSSSSL